MGAQKIKLSPVQTLEAWPVKFKGSKDYVRLIHVIFFFLRLCDSSHLGLKNCD